MNLESNTTPKINEQHLNQNVAINKHQLINNQVLRKIKIVVESDIKNWAYISLR